MHTQQVGYLLAAKCRHIHKYCHVDWRFLCYFSDRPGPARWHRLGIEFSSLSASHHDIQPGYVQQQLVLLRIAENIGSLHRRVCHNISRRPSQFLHSNCLLEQLCYCIVRTRAVNIMQFSRAISLVCIAAYSPVLSAVLAEDVTVTETVIETVTVSEPWEVS